MHHVGSAPRGGGGLRPTTGSAAAATVPLSGTGGGEAPLENVRRQLVARPGDCAGTAAAGGGSDSNGGRHDRRSDANETTRRRRRSTSGSRRGAPSSPGFRIWRRRWSTRLDTARTPAFGWCPRLLGRWAPRMPRWWLLGRAPAGKRRSIGSPRRRRRAATRWRNKSRWAGSSGRTRGGQGVPRDLRWLASPSPSRRPPAASSSPSSLSSSSLVEADEHADWLRAVFDALDGTIPAIEASELANALRALAFRRRRLLLRRRRRRRRRRPPR